MKKTIGVILLAVAASCALLILAVRFYLTQHLYVAEESDEDLIATLFDVDFPGYKTFTILESEGEGLRRIPRHILISVEIHAYPEPVECKAEIFFDVGDPMALGAQWQTLECVGQHFLIESIRSVISSGLDPTICHADVIANMLAFWIREGVITPSEILSPEYREQILTLADDDAAMASIPHLDSGIFDTRDILIHSLGGEGEPGYAAYVLRCDGAVDGYITPHHGQVYELADLGYGDYLLPDILDPGSTITSYSTPAFRPKEETGSKVEVTVIPVESCAGWNCQAAGIVFGESGEPGNELTGARISLQQFSYCSPTGGEQRMPVDDHGTFAFDIYLHDTDQLTFAVEADGYEPFSLPVSGMECLSCSCFPLEIILAPAP